MKASKILGSNGVSNSKSPLPDGVFRAFTTFKHDVIKPGKLGVVISLTRYGYSCVSKNMRVNVMMQALWVA